MANPRGPRYIFNTPALNSEFSQRVYQKGGQILYKNMNISNVSSESVRLHFFKIFALPLLFSLAKLTSDTRHFDLNSILSMTFLQSSLCTLELFGIFEKKGISVAFFVPL